MKVNLIAFLMAAIAGCAMAVQGSLNAALGKIIGLLESTLVVTALGAITAFLALYPLKLGEGGLTQITEASWYKVMGGPLLVLITYSVAFSIPRLGVANATTAIVAIQVTTAIVIDHFGLFGLEAVSFSWWKLLGLGLLAAGTRIMLAS